MKKLRVLLSVLLAAVALNATACTSITGWDDDCDIPGSNSRCDL